METDEPRRARSYDQRCPLAFALDRVGDRWTMLIVRELLGGPAKFGELSAALPGAASNLLTERLRRLEADGLVGRDGPSGPSVYRITERGEGLRPALEALGVWGAALGPREGEDPAPLSEARSVAMGLQAMLRRGPPAARSWRLELVIGDRSLGVELGRAPTVSAVWELPVDATVEVDGRAIAALTVDGVLLVDRWVHVSGDPAATQALIDALGPQTDT